MELSFLGAKVPGNESSTLWNFRSRERKFLGTKVPATNPSIHLEVTVNYMEVYVRSVGVAKYRSGLHLTLHHDSPTYSVKKFDTVADEWVILFSHCEINFAGVRNVEVRPVISTDRNHIPNCKLSLLEMAENEITRSSAALPKKFSKNGDHVMVIFHYLSLAPQ